MSLWNDYAALTEQRCKRFVHNLNLIVSNNSFAGTRKKQEHIYIYNMSPHCTQTTPVIYICGVVLETLSLAT